MPKSAPHPKRPGLEFTLQPSDVQEDQADQVEEEGEAEENGLRLHAPPGPHETCSCVDLETGH